MAVMIAIMTGTMIMGVAIMITGIITDFFESAFNEPAIGACVICRLVA